MSDKTTVAEIVERLTDLEQRADHTLNTGGRDDFDPREVPWVARDAKAAILTLQGEIDALIHDMDRLRTSETEHLNRAEAAEAEVVRLREALKETIPHLEENARWLRDAQAHAGKVDRAFAVVDRARAATGKPE